MKRSQIINRLKIKLGKGCSLGVTPASGFENIQLVNSPEILDFDPVFLARFPVSELMENRVTILHSSKTVDWQTTWVFDDKSALWNFNLHYFEYLFPLIKAWKDTEDKEYLDKTIEIINGWIDSNSIGKAPGWASYPTALRIVNWISWYGYVSNSLDEEFRDKFLLSLHTQFAYLIKRLEKDILGNHYFEDLKSLVIASIFFKDDAVLQKALIGFKSECKEEILDDGMHFELSPMYHKIIFEGLLRTVVALNGSGRKDLELESYVQPMLDVAFSFEEGLERIPLFNDCGNNVAKSLDALVRTSAKLGFNPVFKSQMNSSGFYIFHKKIDGNYWKLIVDAGQPGPQYIPGHAHCDAMSFELFCNGKPVIVNCGTYAYQCDERNFFRSTEAHNTVMIYGTEQSQCWGTFRLAKRSSTKVLDVSDSTITMEMIDQRGHRIQRHIKITDYFFVSDKSEGYCLVSYIHNLGNMSAVSTKALSEESRSFYAADYGVKNEIPTLKLISENQIEFNIDLKSLVTEIGVIA